MIDSFTIKLPATIEVAGSLYTIKTNFTYWISFYQAINDKSTLLGELDFIYESSPPKNRVDGYNALLEFFNPPRLLPRPEQNNGEKILDYVIDFELIAAAFYEQYNIDLYDEKLKLHWHKFLILLEGLHDVKLTEVMGYRCYDNNGDHKDKYNKQMLKQKRLWALPQDTELTQATKDFNALFK